MKIKLVVIAVCFVFSLQASVVENRTDFLNSSLICKSLEYLKNPANKAAVTNSAVRLNGHIEGQVSTRVWASFIDEKEDLRHIFDSKYAAQKLGLVRSNVKAVQELIEKYRMQDPNTGNIKVLEFAYATMPHFIASRYEDRTTDFVDAYVEQRYASNNNPLDYIELRESDIIGKDDILRYPNIRKGLALAIVHEYNKARFGHKIYRHTLKPINLNYDDKNSTKKAPVILRSNDIKDFGDVVDAASIAFAYIEDVRAQVESHDFDHLSSSTDNSVDALQYLIIKHKNFENSLDDCQCIESLLNRNPSLKFMYVYDDLQEEMNFRLMENSFTVIPHLIFVGKSIKRIKYARFLNLCIKKITFDGLENVEEIESDFLRYSESLEEVDLSGLKKVKILGDLFLGGSKKLKKLSTVGLENVEKIGYGFQISWGLCKSFSVLLVQGIITLITLQFIINLMVSTGLAPTKGIGLPFISYGNTALVCNLFMIGLVANAVQTET